MMRNKSNPQIARLVGQMLHGRQLPEHPGPIDAHVNTCPHCGRGIGRRVHGRQLRCETSEVTRTTYHRGVKTGIKTTTQPGCGYEWNG